MNDKNNGLMDSMNAHENAAESADGDLEVAKRRLSSRLGQHSSQRLASSEFGDLNRRLLEMELELMRLEFKNAELHSEKELSERQFEEVLAATLDGVWNWQINAGRVKYSEQWCRLLGYEPSEVPDTLSFFYSLLHGDDVALVNEALQDHFEGRITVKQGEVRLRTKSGRYEWFLDRGKVVEWDQAGKPVRMVGTITSISARKEAEQALLASERELRLIANNVPGPLARVDLNLRYLYVNDEYVQVFQKSFSEIVGRSMAEVLPPDLYQQVLPNIAIVLTGKRVTFETHFHSQLGVEKHTLVHYIPDFDPAGDLKGFVVIGLDISARKKAEADRKRAEVELQLAKEKLEQAQALASTGNWSVNVATGHTYWSKQLFFLFGRSPELGPLHYPEVLDAFHPDDVPLLDSAFQETMKSGTGYSLVRRIKNGLGGYRFARCEGRVLRDESGLINEVYGTVSDVTEEIEREEALQIARKEAEVANRTKSEFLANMSHEIRTPLTAILGFTEVLRDEENSSSQTGSPSDGLAVQVNRIQTLDTIANAGNHLLAIINDILDLSKIEANMATFEKIEFSLFAFLREVEGLVRSIAKGKGVELTIAFQTSMPDRICCDPSRLRQILLNLLGNAIKFTEGGKISVSIALGLTGIRPMLEVDVEDTGRGIPPDQIDRLFQPFVQADNSITRTHGGTGLGLHISKRLANLMGGDVTLVRSEIGKGSCFRILLPIDLPQNSCWLDQNHAPKEIVAEPLNKEPLHLQGRILLVEDGIDNQKLIAFHLRKAGAVVEVAENGRIALELIDSCFHAGQPFDLLLTDIQMPEMDGYELTKILRMRGITIPIVALTAHALAEDRMKCMQAGCNDYESKPIVKAQLLATCRKWLMHYW